MRDLQASALGSILLLTQLASASPTKNTLQGRAIEAVGLVTWNSPSAKEPIAQCYPLVFNYLTPVAPKIIEVAYRWRNQTYIKEVHSYDANSSSAYWTDAKTVMVYQVNKLPFPAGAVMAFRITDQQDNLSYLEGSGFTVQPSDDKSCVVEQWQKEAQGPTGTVATGQGIFTTVTRTPAGASSATGSAVPLSTDAPVADPSSVASLDGNGSHSPALSKAAIGGIAAAAAVAVLAGLGVYVFLRRRKARRAQLGPSPDEDAGMDFSDTPMGMEGAGAAAMAPSPWTYTVASQPEPEWASSRPGSYMIQERDAGLAPDDGSFVERVPPGYSEATSKATPSMVSVATPVATADADSSSTHHSLMEHKSVIRGTSEG